MRENCHAGSAPLCNTGRLPAPPDMVNHVIDVRDCAAMHYLPLMNDPATNGQRHFAFAMTGKMTDMTDIIRKNYRDMGFCASAVGFADLAALEFLQRVLVRGRQPPLLSKLSCNQTSTSPSGRTFIATSTKIWRRRSTP